MDFRIKGLTLSAPSTQNVDKLCDFIENTLAPAGVNLLVLLIRYRFSFKTQPECASWDPLSWDDAKKISAACKKHNIRLIPKMNLFGHQSEKEKTSFDGLLRSHPEFDETPDVETAFYCRSLCPTHPDIKPIVFSLMDDMIDAFDADGLHIGCDEVFDIGKCPRCKDTPNYKLFADWVSVLHSHLSARGVETFMWGDRLIDSKDCFGNEWEASANDTFKAVDLIPKDIIICNWHYGVNKSYPSVDMFENSGFRVLISPYMDIDAAHAYINYANEHNRGNVLGVLATTWCSPEDIWACMEGKEPRWEGAKQVTATITDILSL